MNDIPPLTVHPLPFHGEKFSKWCERSANANFIEFGIFLKYVGSVANSIGLEQAIKQITQVPEQDYSKLNFDLKDMYWNHEARCPILGCDFETIAKNFNETLKKHIANMHNI